MRVRLKRLEGAAAEAAEAAAAEAAAEKEAAAKGGKGGKADPKKARRHTRFITPAATDLKPQHLLARPPTTHGC